MVRGTGTAMSKALLSSTTRGVTLTSARICKLMSCVKRHVHVPRDRRVHDEGTYRVGSIHDEDQACAQIRYGLEEPAS